MVIQFLNSLNYDWLYFSFIYFIGFLFLLTGFLMLISESQVHSILYLMFLFVYLTELAILFKMEFLALIFIIVYIGAVCVLMLFHIKLIKTYVHRFEKINSKELFFPFSIIAIFLPIIQIATLRLESLEKNFPKRILNNLDFWVDSHFKEKEKPKVYLNSGVWKDFVKQEKSETSFQGNSVSELRNWQWQIPVTDAETAAAAREKLLQICGFYDLTKIKKNYWKKVLENFSQEMVDLQKMSLIREQKFVKICKIIEKLKWREEQLQKAAFHVWMKSNAGIHFKNPDRKTIEKLLEKSMIEQISIYRNLTNYSSLIEELKEESLKLNLMDSKIYNLLKETAILFRKESSPIQINYVGEMSLQVYEKEYREVKEYYFDLAERDLRTRVPVPRIRFRSTFSRKPLEDSDESELNWEPVHPSNFLTIAEQRIVRRSYRELLNVPMGTNTDAVPKALKRIENSQKFIQKLDLKLKKDSVVQEEFSFRMPYQYFWELKGKINLKLNGKFHWSHHPKCVLDLRENVLKQKDWDSILKKKEKFFTQLPNPGQRRWTQVIDYLDHLNKEDFWKKVFSNSVILKELLCRDFENSSYKSDHYGKFPSGPSLKYYLEQELGYPYFKEDFMSLNLKWNLLSDMVDDQIHLWNLACKYYLSSTGPTNFLNSVNHVNSDYTNWVELVDSNETTEMIGIALYKHHWIGLALGGLILLSAMIGSIFLTLSDRKKKKFQKINEQLFLDISNSVILDSKKIEKVEKKKKKKPKSQKKI